MYIEVSKKRKDATASFKRFGNSIHKRKICVPGRGEMVSKLVPLEHLSRNSEIGSHWVLCTFDLVSHLSNALKIAINGKCNL